MNQLPAGRNDGAPDVPPMNIQQTTIVNAVQSPKNVGLAVVLAFLFGPLGLLYSSVLGAAVMFIIALVVVVPTLGAGLLLVIPACMLWAGLAASDHNKALANGGPATVQSYSSLQHSAIGHSQPLPPAGWFTDPEGSEQYRYWNGTRWTTHFAPKSRKDEGRASPPQLGR